MSEYRIDLLNSIGFGWGSIIGGKKAFYYSKNIKPKMETVSFQEILIFWENGFILKGK